MDLRISTCGWRHLTSRDSSNESLGRLFRAHEVRARARWGVTARRAIRRGMSVAVFENVGLVAAVVALVVAQGLKPLTARGAGGPWKPSLAFASGGFPSSHSAFVCALATGVGAQWGLDSGSFACAVVIACVVMYDATGVRRQAGFRDGDQHARGGRVRDERDERDGCDGCGAGERERGRRAGER